MSSSGTLVIAAIVIVFVLSAVVAVAYFVLNKPIKSEAPLISDTQIQALMAKYNDVASLPVQYSNILGYSLGHTGHVMAPPLSGSITIRGCNNYCNGTTGCQGFQYNASTSTCELLSNVSNTFYTSDPGWNLFVTGTHADSAMGAEETGVGYSTAGVPPLVGITTYDDCLPYCFSNAHTCKGMSISPSGCDLLSTGATQVASAGTNSWQVVNNLAFGQGLPLATSPSPS